MKKFSIIALVMLLAGCSGMDTRSSSGSSMGTGSSDYGSDQGDLYRN